jgi:phosphonoacetaldehyde hydrolase
MVELCAELRKRGIKIGSTTGYNDKIMSILTAGAQEKGYRPDSLVTPDKLPAGRPAPYMCYQNAINLEVYPMGAILKVGDTLSDIQEGLNAGMWTAGVVKGSNELGLCLDEVNNIDPDELENRCIKIREKYILNGAHFTAETISDVLDIIDQINSKAGEL